MSSSALQLAVETLSADFHELTDCVDFLSAAGSVRPRLNEALAWERMDAGLKGLAQRFLKQRDAVLECAYRGLFVSAASSYEQCIREIVQAGAIAISQRAQGFDQLSEQFRFHHINLTGRALATIFSPRRHQRYDFTLLARNIGSCLPGNKSFTINSDVFAADIVTPDSEGLKNALERIGIRDCWEDVGRDSAVQAVFGSSKARETRKSAEDFVEDFVTKRNSIAHSGRATATVVESEIREVLNVLPVICEALAKTVGSVASAG